MALSAPEPTRQTAWFVSVVLPGLAFVLLQMLNWRKGQPPPGGGGKGSCGYYGEHLPQISAPTLQTIASKVLQGTLFLYEKPRVSTVSPCFMEAERP